MGIGMTRNVLPYVGCHERYRRFRGAPSHCASMQHVDARQTVVNIDEDFLWRSVLWIIPRVHRCLCTKLLEKWSNAVRAKALTSKVSLSLV